MKNKMEEIKDKIKVIIKQDHNDCIDDFFERIDLYKPSNNPEVVYEDIRNIADDCGFDISSKEDALFSIEIDEDSLLFEEPIYFIRKEMYSQRLPIIQELQNLLKGVA